MPSRGHPACGQSIVFITALAWISLVLGKPTPPCVREDL